MFGLSGISYENQPNVWKWDQNQILYRQVWGKGNPKVNTDHKCAALKRYNNLLNLPVSVDCNKKQKILCEHSKSK